MASAVHNNGRLAFCDNLETIRSSQKGIRPWGMGRESILEGHAILFDGEFTLRALVRALLVVTLDRFAYPLRRMLSAAAGLGRRYDQSSVFWHLCLIVEKRVSVNLLTLLQCYCVLCCWV